MGLLRFYLAAAVIGWHSDGLGRYLAIPGYTAVQVFYIISGFYMALVLNTKYVGPGSYRVFLANRLLRIFPSYWLILLVTFVVSLLASRYVGHSRLSDYQTHPLTPGTWIYLITMNLSILGQDTILFLDLTPGGSLAWPTNFVERPVPQLHEFMLLSQGWSLSLELMFYAIAPFLVRRKIGIVLAVIALSFGVRVVTYLIYGYHVDPWSYRFFPSELALFLAGTISYHIDLRLRDRRPARGWIIGVSVAFGLVTLGYQYLKSSLPTMAQEVFYWGYFALAAVAIPFLFQLTGKNKWDRYIGELSFPIYVVHILVLMFVANLVRKLGGRFDLSIGLTCLAVSAVLAMGMVKYFIEPIERFRHHLTSRDLGVEKSPGGPVGTG